MVHFEIYCGVGPCQNVAHEASGSHPEFPAFLATVSRVTGLAVQSHVEKDLDGQPLPKGQVRRAGGGRRALCASDPGLVPALKRLVEPRR